MRSELHPEIAEVLEIFDALGAHKMAELGPQGARDLFATLRADPETYEPVHSVTDSVADGVPIRIFRPSAEADLGVLLWFHGGGWVFGDLHSTEIPGRSIANAANCVVIGVDYRLAPETLFPGAFDDCLAVTNWVAANAETLRVDGGQIAVGGDSAGGNLAACVAIACRDGLGPTLTHQLLIYPVVDAAMTQPSYGENGEGYLLETPSMTWFWDCYVPDVSQRADWRVAPGSADLTGVASAWVYTVGFDPLRDEGREYADQLESAGIAVERYEQADAIHSVFGMPIQRGAEARAAASASLKQAFD